MKLTKSLRDFLVSKGLAQDSWTDDQLFAKAAADALESGELSPEQFSELTGKKTAEDVFGGVRVKKASERYSTTKSVAKHARTLEPVCNERGKQVETVSELEYAKAGVLMKRLAAKSGVPVSLDEHERSLEAEIFDTDKWCGKLGSQYETGIPGARVKALLDDATSGGAEVVPEWFDDAVIQYPLLHSEIFPKIDLRDVPRASSIETASVGNPTVTWGTAEGTEIGLFDTADIIAEINATVHPVVCAVEIGRDFLADAAVDVGRILVENIGQRMLSELDQVIVLGNGTTQPEGILNASGITDIGNPAGGDGAVPQVDDFETLMFSVGKQYRNGPMRPAFISNDTSYSRARGIPVGAADARRVFGMEHNSYELFQYHYLINNTIANNQIVYGALAKYRMWRRQAQEVRFVTEGKELARKNQVLLIVRGRFAGRVVDPNAFAFSDNWQA